MRQQIRIKVIALLLTLACSNANSSDADVAANNDVQKKTSLAAETGGTAIKTADKPGAAVELEWNDLIPDDWVLDDLIEEFQTSGISDDDPRARELLKKIQQALNDAPVIEAYDGKQVKLPGFVVPLELDTNTIREFLLVPYFGACVHSPPPPANQTVYVVADEDRAYQGELFDTVWVTGTMKIERVTSKMGDAGYRIDVTRVEPFE